MTTTQDLLAQYNITPIPHPPYSPDLAPNDFFLYLRIKKNLRGRFPYLNSVEAVVNQEIAGIGRDKYCECMLVKWPQRWQKCLANQGKYFEGMN